MHGQLVFQKVSSIYLPSSVFSIDIIEAGIRQNVTVLLDRVEMVTPLRDVGGKVRRGLLWCPTIVCDQQTPTRLQHLMESVGHPAFRTQRLQGIAGREGLFAR